MEFDVGERLKRHRKAKGLSQRQLAARAGVTNGMISMIEQNHTSPSISSLKKILEALPLTLGEFFAEGQAQEERCFFRHEDLHVVRTSAIHGSDGDGPVSGLQIRLVGASGQHGLQMLHETYEPGADTGEPYRHDAEEAGIVVEGQLEVTVGDQVQVLGPGDAYIFDSRLPHRFRNTGTVRCRLVSAVTPPTF